MNSTPSSSTSLQYRIRHPSSTPRKSTQLTVLLNDQTCLQETLKTEVLESGIKIVMQPPNGGNVPDAGPSGFLISDPLRGTRAGMWVSVRLDDQLCWRKRIKTGELQNGIELIVKSRNASTPSTQGASTLALIELEIPGAVGPLPSPPAEEQETLLGINHGAAKDNFPQHGLQLYIPAWQRMSVADSVEVWLDDKKIVTETITLPEVDQRVTTFIEARHLEQPPFRHALYYKVRRVGQTAEPSEATNMLVKLDRPGGKDKNGNTPGHSELTFTLPEEIIKDGVHAGHLEQGVQVTINRYPNIAELDVIKLSWGGRFIFHTVTKAQAEEDEDKAEKIVLTVTKDDILAAGDSGPNGLAVTYEVYDVVQNRSEDWAAEIRIVVEAGNSRLASPIIKEAVNNVLNLDVLADRPVTAQIIAWNTNPTKPDFNLGDKVVVTMKGTTTQGTEVLFTAPEVVIDSLPKVIEVSIPNIKVRELAKTQAIFSYEVKNAQGGKATSRGAFISIVGEAIRLPAPVAKDAVKGAIDPDLPSTRVEVPWDDSLVAGDMVTLKWLGTRPDTSIYDPAIDPWFISGGDVAAKQPLVFVVGGTHLKAIEGGTLQLYYLFEQEANGAVLTRESNRTQTLVVGAPRNELPAPSVENVVDGALDPDLSSTRLVVPNYPGKAKGDQIKTTWKGSASGILNNEMPVKSGNLAIPIKFTIPGSAIKPNDQGTVEASYEVARADGKTSYSDINSFDVGVIALDPPTIASITDSKGVEIPANASTFDTSVTVTGTASPNQTVDVLDGTTSKGKPKADASGNWTLTLTGLGVAAYAIKAVAQYGSGAESAVRNFTVAAAVTPTIASIKDSKGVEIPANASTFDTSVTVTGTASPNQTVDVLDGTTSKGKPKADASGDWTLTITGLSAAAHAIKAVAQYGSNPASAVRNFTVAAAVTPTIASIKDSKGVEIPANGTTFDTRVTVSGKASPNQSVEVFDGATSKGQSTANASGDWTADLTGLSVAAHAIKAVAQYSDKPASGVRNFTVIAVTAVAITDVKDSKGASISDGGTTTDTSVTISGTVTYTS